MKIYCYSKHIAFLFLECIIKGCIKRYFWCIIIFILKSFLIFMTWNLVKKFIKPNFAFITWKIATFTRKLFSSNWVLLIHLLVTTSWRLRKLILDYFDAWGFHTNYKFVANINDFCAQNVTAIFMYAIAI